MISRIIRRLSSYPSHLVIKMPALSPTMESGNIGEFKKRIGDSVEPGDVLVEIETDKATMDFELQEEGFVARLLANTGDKDVKVNSPLAILVHDASHVDKFKDWSHDAENTAATSASENTAATSASENTAATSASENTANTASLIGNIANRVFASPAAKALALKSNIALSNINGSGPNSRILLSDVKNHQPTPVALPKSSPPVAPVAPVSAAFKDIPVSNIRKVIAKRLLESKQQIPHYYLTSEISVDKLLKLRETLNADSNGKFKLSVNDFVIKASSLALQKVPQINSSWHETFIRQYEHSDISVAVATENGLITPIVKRSQQKGIAQISNELKKMANLAKINKLEPSDYQGGTFCISNLGMFGIDSFTAIINPPQSSILAVGTIGEKLVLDGESVKAVQTMKLTLSNDHRVIDGAVGAQFMQVLKELLENPLRLML